MKWMRELFSENNGNLSSIRVMAMICVIASVVIAIVGLNRVVVDYSGLALLCSTFLGAGLGSKVYQKRTEVDGAKSEITTDIK